jgi:predicted exporter
MREAGDADTAVTLANGDARTRSPLTVIERAASEVLYRENGEYQALRLAVSVDESADGSETTDEMQAVASVAGGDGRTVTATGGVVILAVAYRIAHGSATLGVVTLLPVVFGVSWIIGTMYVIGYPLSVVTSVIASITVGIGIDWARLQSSEETATPQSTPGVAGPDD